MTTIDEQALAMAAAAAERRRALYLAHCERKLAEALEARDWAEEHAPGHVAANALHSVDFWLDMIEQAKGEDDDNR